MRQGRLRSRRSCLGDRSRLRDLLAGRSQLRERLRLRRVRPVSVFSRSVLLRGGSRRASSEAFAVLPPLFGVPVLLAATVMLAAAMGMAAATADVPFIVSLRFGSIETGMMFFISLASSAASGVVSLSFLAAVVSSAGTFGLGGLALGMDGTARRYSCVSSVLKSSSTKGRVSACRNTSSWSSIPWRSASSDLSLRTSANTYFASACGSASHLKQASEML